MVAQLNEHYFTGEFLLREGPGSYSRDVVTFDNLAGALDLLVEAGTVVQSTSPATAVVTAGSNTGNGSISNVQPNLTAVEFGTYTVTMLTPTTYSVTAPDGTPLNNGATGTGYLDQIGFQLNAGGTAFAAGDSFTITIADGVPPAVVAHAGNTGNGTLTNVETVQTAVTLLGNYKIVFTGATTFNVYSPSGTEKLAGTTGTYYQDEIGFLITSGGTAFVAGDSFTIGVVAGTGHVVAWTGSAPPIGIIYNTDYAPAGGSLKFTAVTRMAEVIASALRFPAFPNGVCPAAAQTTCFNALKAIGIVAR